MSKPGSPTLGSLRANCPEGQSHEVPITSEEICDAAEALREVEIEAAREDAEAANADTVEWKAESAVEEEVVIPVHLDELSIDELRAIAGMLQIPNYGQITDQDELVAMIEMYVGPKSRKVPK
ncbi:MAG: hypothetical protein SH868_00065 [Bythopirellula sp.]|nr:hypothetical protein [Bythopirellula sp.]